MNLYRKDTGIPFINEQVSGVYPYKYSDEPIDGWVNISTEDAILNNDLYGGYAADYVRATKEMATLFEYKEGETEQKKWDNCTDTEKECLSSRMIINNISLRLEVFTEEEDAYNFTQHAEISINCRELRIEFAKISMGYQLSVIDRVELFNSIQLMIDSYVNTNDTSLTTWMNSEEGFKSQPYYTTVLLATYTEIVQNGIY
tara:strand:+ start:91 stop:693 length:603 start_codon:yes stop_codon:yes gene_type:complete